LVSIVLFFLILVFLYETLESKKISNNFFAAKLTKTININKVKEIFIKDVLESNDLIIKKDKNKNTILQLQTSNMYHNLFFKYVTYFVSRNNNLIRIESLNKFDETNINDSFLENTFIDVVISKVTRFEVSALKDNKKAFAITIDDDKELLLFVSLKR